MEKKEFNSEQPVEELCTGVDSGRCCSRNCFGMEFLLEIVREENKKLVICIPGEQNECIFIEKPPNSSSEAPQFNTPFQESNAASFFNCNLNRQIYEKSFVSILLHEQEQLSHAHKKCIVIYGVLGILNAFNDDYLAVVSDCECAGQVRNHLIYRITGVAFYSLTDFKYDKFWSSSPDSQLSIPGTFPSSPSPSIKSNPSSSKQLSNANADSLIMHPCHEIAKFLSSGTFYFSYGTDVSSILSDYGTEMGEFVWNFEMKKVFDEAFDKNPSILQISLISIIQGFYEECSVPLRVSHPIVDSSDKNSTKFDGERGSFEGNVESSSVRTNQLDNNSTVNSKSDFPNDNFNRVSDNTNDISKSTVLENNADLRHERKERTKNVSLNAKIGLFSKVSWKRTGTRFNSRGCDDDGNCSNFVYSTLFFDIPDSDIFTYDILRGSVPVFWEQTGIQVGQHRIQILRTFPTTQPAFDLHFKKLLSRHSNVFVIDLLSQSKSTSEYQLSNLYRKHILQLANQSISYTCFDFNSLCKNDFSNFNILLKKLSQYFNGIGYCFGEKYNQNGIFRVNCLDCLDRTNVVQCNISNEVFFNFLRSHSHSFHINLAQSHLLSILNMLWANNGDVISKINTGTGALKSGLTRSGRRSFFEYVDDMAKSAQRFFINSFQDRDRQQIIDLVLSRYPEQLDVVLDYEERNFVQQQILKKRAEFEFFVEKNIFCITWNVAGLVGCKVPTHNNLFDIFKSYGEDSNPDVIVVCLQEIVPLNASNIMQINNNLVETSKKKWELIFDNLINQYFSNNEYQLILTNQLVGISLMLWIRDSSCLALKNLESCIKKTGLKGMAGNKGAIACRFDLYDSSFCILGCHFAAGQDEIEERNSNYFTILDNVNFSQGKRIENHQTVVWLGDLNYRIDLDFYQSANLASRGQFEKLWKYDQLIGEMAKRRVFEGFREAPLSFYPTYRYEIRGSGYIIDEKLRVPSWTDRILLAGLGEQVSYTAIQNINISDHRPVIAVFKVPVCIVDRKVKIRIEQELKEKEKSKETDLISFNDDFESLENTLNDFSIEN